MTLTTRFYTALFGQWVGTDQFGNLYFRRKGATHGTSSVGDKRKGEKRWVLYKGLAEPSKVPPEWHGWLHYTHATLPDGHAAHYGWEKPPLPNLTGTTGAYLPQGHLDKGGRHAPTAAQYEPWRPS